MKSPLFMVILGLALILRLEGVGREKKALTEIVSQEVVGKTPIKPRVLETQHWLEGSVEVSPDGRRVVWVQRKTGGLRVVVNGTNGPVHDDIGMGFTFSEDGRRFAYVAIKGDAEANVIDGKVGRFYTRVTRPVFSPDGEHFWYLAAEGTKHFLVMDEVPQALEAKALPYLILSGDGLGVAYVEVTDGGEQVVVNGKKRRAYDFIEGDTLRSSRQNNQFDMSRARRQKIGGQESASVQIQP
jgi:hypothetical protein